MEREWCAYLGLKVCKYIFVLVRFSYCAPSPDSCAKRKSGKNHRTIIGLSALQKPLELNLPRFTLGKLYASRSGHGDFAEYHKRFKHVDAEGMCQCGRNKTPEHFFLCRLGRRAARQPWGPLGVKEVLTTQCGTNKLDQWLAESGYFRRVCPPYPQLQTRNGDGGGARDGDT